MDWCSNGQTAGTTGESKRMEAVEIKLTGAISKQYDVYYRVHVQGFGWMGWAKNGESAGTTGYSRRIEAIQIKLVPSGLGAPGSTANAFKEKKYTGKLVALTFDDGPGVRCAELLNCLEKYGAHATFYVVGTNARLRSNLLTRMESIGCETTTRSLRSHQEA
jgi:peptidoglycan/xylan/chitin deacetylase (PgdA/CDA1 family)